MRLNALNALVFAEFSELFFSFFLCQRRRRAASCCQTTLRTPVFVFAFCQKQKRELDDKKTISFALSTTGAFNRMHFCRILSFCRIVPLNLNAPRS